MCLRCGRARLITILALAGVAVAGFLAGHYSARPVTFNFIGSRIDPRLQPAAPASQAEEHQVPAGARGAAVTASNGSVPSGTAAARPLYVGYGICGAPTKSGKPCQRRVRGGGYCWQHRDKVHG